MDVSIIIVNYNTYSLVINCINTIYEKTKDITFEIIVVDNLSPDRSIENLCNIYPDINLILNTANNGFGSGNNLGSNYASGKYLFFLNSDTLLLNNAIYEMFIFMERNPNVGACGGNLYDVNGLPAVSFEQYFPGIFRDIDMLLYSLISKSKYGKNLVFNYTNFPIEINGYISGADLFISRDLFFHIGRFDQDFFMYYEETELIHRVKRINKKIFVLPQAKIIHLEGGSQVGLNVKKMNWMKESKTKYFDKTNTKGLYLSNMLVKCIMFRDSLMKKIFFKKG